MEKSPVNLPLEIKIDSEEEQSTSKTTSSGTQIIRPPTFPSRVQDELKAKIAYLNQRLTSKLLARDTGLSSSNTKMKIKKLRQTIVSTNVKLKRLQSNAKHQKIHRDKRRKLLKDLKAQCPKQSADIIVQDDPGRPRLSDQLILDHILKLVDLGSAADPRRRSINSTSCKTLDQLHHALLDAGLEISRSATYLRLQPRDGHTQEGKRHVVTAPVKLARPTADLHKSHQDASFCTTTIRYLESLASMLGPDQVIFLSQVNINSLSLIIFVNVIFMYYLAYIVIFYLFRMIRPECRLELLPLNIKRHY